MYDVVIKDNAIQSALLVLNKIEIFFGDRFS